MTDLDAAMERIFRLGPSEAMREDERAMGFTPILAGEYPWFPLEDWSLRDVVSIKGNCVRIVAIHAWHPKSGAFSRMITRLAKADMKPIVVEAMFDMPPILTRWGWTSKIIGDGFDQQEVWEPSDDWLKQRAIMRKHRGIDRG
jgi:hypothetical protein